MPSTSLPRRARRRPRVLVAAITLLASLAVAFMLTVLASRYHARWDVTASAEHRLAPRTRALMGDSPAGEAGSGYRVVIATDLRTIDQRARTNLTDVLRELEAFRPDFSSTMIDTGSAAGIDQFRSLTRDLYERDKPGIESHLAKLRDARSQLKSMENDLEGAISDQLLRIRDSIDPAGSNGSALRSYFEGAAAGLRVRAGDISRAHGESLTAAPDVLAGEEVVIPDTDRAAATLKNVTEALSRDLSAISRELERFIQAGAIAENGLGASSIESARTAAALVTSARDRTAVLLSSLGGMKRLDATRVAGALRAGNAALIMAPKGKGVVAMDMGSILPGSAWLDAAQAGRGDLRRRVEDVIATSVSSLESDIRPVLVVMHAEQRAQYFEMGVMDAMRERLYLRGVDCIEWCIMASPAPDTSRVPDAASRPRVYLVMSTNDAAAAPAQGAPTGAQRAAKLAEEVGKLFAAGESVILNLAPSMLPSFGEKDPMSVTLQQFGLNASTGTPLLSSTLTGRGATTETDRIVQAMPSSLNSVEAQRHALAGAIQGLPTYLTWAIPIVHTGPSSTARVSPILTVPVSLANPPTTWAESEWQRFRSVRREERALMPDQPAFTAGRDQAAPEHAHRDGENTWMIAAAVEAAPQTTQASTARPLRFVVVGSNDWCIDQVTQQGTMLDGRATYQNPGNLELLENAILWLTHQDRLIAQSAASRAVPIIQPIPESRLRVLRLLIIFGLPTLVLLTGGIVRVLQR